MNTESYRSKPEFLSINEVKEALRMSGYVPPTWNCPKCKKGFNMGVAVWSGKNLQCPECKEFSYYSEYTVCD